MDDYFRKMPKAELHLHLEGSLEPETLRELDPALSGREIRSRYSYGGFQDFIESYKWVLGLLRGPDEYALAARRLLDRLAMENVVYAEVTLSAGAVLWQGKEFAPIFEAVAREAERSSVEVSLILDAVRHFGVDHAMAAARLAADRAGGGVVAFGIGGDETRGPAERFAPVFRFVRERGLRVTVHAGEAAGPESVWAAVRAGADRIGHGVAAARDPGLLRRLGEDNIPIEVCLSSNVATGAVPKLAAHPLRLFLEHGVPVVLNTDDPAMFQTTLLREYEIAAGEFSLTRAELEGIVRNGFRYAFQPMKSTGGQ